MSDDTSAQEMLLRNMRESIEENRMREEREQIRLDHLDALHMEMRQTAEQHYQDNMRNYEQAQRQQYLDQATRQYEQEYNQVFSRADLDSIKEMIGKSQQKRRERNHFEDDDDLFEI